MKYWGLLSSDSVKKMKQIDKIIKIGIIGVFIVEIQEKFGY